jgi:hypothetical protein
MTNTEETITKLLTLYEEKFAALGRAGNGVIGEHQFADMLESFQQENGLTEEELDLLVYLSIARTSAKIKHKSLVKELEKRKTL